MLVRELMTSPATSLRAGSRLESAVQVLAAQHITAVPIVDPYGHVVGIVSDADVLREGLPEDPRARLRPVHESTTPWHRLVDEVMTVDPVTVGAHTDAARAAELMADMGWKSLPVVRDGQLVGVISRSDIMRALATPDAADSGAHRLRVRPDRPRRLDGGRGRRRRDPARRCPRPRDATGAGDRRDAARRAPSQGSGAGSGARSCTHARAISSSSLVGMTYAATALAVW